MVRREGVIWMLCWHLLVQTWTPQLQRQAANYWRIKLLFQYLTCANKPRSALKMSQWQAVEEASGSGGAVKLIYFPNVPPWADSCKRLACKCLLTQTLANTVLLINFRTIKVRLGGSGGRGKKQRPAPRASSLWCYRQRKDVSSDVQRNMASVHICGNGNASPNLDSIPWGSHVGQDDGSLVIYREARAHKYSEIIII